jgi:hypothetical protein
MSNITVTIPSSTTVKVASIGTQGTIGNQGSTGIGATGFTGATGTFSGSNRELLYLDNTSVVGATGLTWVKETNTLTMTGQLSIDPALISGKRITNIGVTETVIDESPISTFRTVKYVLQVSYLTNFQCSEILLIHNGTTAYISEYSRVHTSANPLVTYTTNITGGNIRLIASAAAGSTTKIDLYKIAFGV